MDASKLIPLPLWERILKCDNISARDILSMSSTCKDFRESLLSNDALWRSKFTQRWPDLAKELSKSATTTTTATKNWFELYRQRNEITRIAKKFLHDLSVRYLHQETRALPYTAYEAMSNFANQSEQNALFLIDELRFILNCTPANVRLTDKYYAEDALRYLWQQMLTPVLRQLVDSDRQILENDAWLLAKWLSPSDYQLLDDDALEEELNLMTEKTRTKLAETNRWHPLLRITEPIDHENLRESMWSASDTRTVIEALNFVFSTLHGYRGKTDDYSHSLLNKVISSKFGTPVTLCVLYQAVARRSGVYCDPVKFPRRFLLKFLDNPALPGDRKYTYIDVADYCRLMRGTEVLVSHGVNNSEQDRKCLESPPNSVSVLIYMLCDLHAVLAKSKTHSHAVLKCSAWELGLLLKPVDFYVRFSAAESYAHLNIHAETILTLMADIPEADDDERKRRARAHITKWARDKLQKDNERAQRQRESPPRLPKFWTSHALGQYAVGMILEYLLLGRRCVIIGWNDRTRYYDCLLNDGWHEIAEDVDLDFLPNTAQIPHLDVGKYFQEHCGRFYKMNDALKAEYPEDEEATIKYVNDSYPRLD